EKQLLKTDGSITQDGITLAVAWSFTNLVVPDQVDAAQFARISAFTAYAEGLEVFVGTPID
ncbi:glutathione S-transferase, partial [Pseudomonas donghuensis]|nr:glutathione S-transferase [Pseudomonas donghuensis]